KLLDFIKNQGVAPEYTEEVISQPTGKIGTNGVADDDERDPMFEEAVRVIATNDTASASLLQRKLKRGYARAARVLDQLESAGLVSAADGSKPREVNQAAAAQYLGGSSTASAEV